MAVSRGKFGPKGTVGMVVFFAMFLVGYILITPDTSGEFRAPKHDAFQDHGLKDHPNKSYSALTHTRHLTRRIPGVPGEAFF